MKKHILSVAALASMLFLVGCGSKTESSPPASSVTPASSVAPTSTSDKGSKESSNQGKDSSAASSSEQETIQVTGHNIASVGETVTLTASVTGVTWSVDHPEIATIKDGVVTALKAGTVKVSAALNGYKTGEFSLEVVDNVAKVANLENPDKTPAVTKGVVLAKGTNGFVLADKAGMENTIYAFGKNNTAKVNVGDYVKVEGTIANNNDFGYELSVDNVAKLEGYDVHEITNTPIDITPEFLDQYNGKGVVYGIVHQGHAFTNGQYKNINFPEGIGGINKLSLDIAGDFKDGDYDVYGYLTSKSKTGNYRTIIVNSDGLKPVTATAPTSIVVTAEGGASSINRGQSLQLNAEIEPYYASKEVTWAVTGSDKVTLDENGLLTAADDAEAGTLTITATTKIEGSTVKGTLTLSLTTKSVSVSAQQYVSVGEEIPVTATLSEEGTAAYTYQVSDDTIASISTDGKLKGLKAGEITITVSNAGFASGTAKVTILDNIANIRNYADKAAVDTKGKVLCKDDYGYILGDNSGYIYVYSSKDKTVEAGDYIHFIGTYSAATDKYTSELKQTSAEKLENYSALITTYTPVEFTDADKDTITTQDGSKYVSIKGVEVKGGAFNLGSKSMKISGSTIADGFYDLTGFAYFNSGKYFIYVDSTKAATRPAATALTIKQGAAANLELGKTLKLEVTQTPVLAKDELTFTSSDATKITVDAEGNVTTTDAAAVGDKATITVASKTNAEVKATIEITIIAKSTVEEKTVEFKPDNSSNTQAKFTLTKDSITLDCTRGMVNSSEIRLYANQTATFKSSAGNIVKIEFTCTAADKTKKGPGNFATLEGYTYSGNTGTWAGDAKEVSFKTTAQVVASKIVVTYKAA